MSRTSIIDKRDLGNFNVFFTETNDKLPSGKTYVMFNRPKGLIDYFTSEGVFDDVLYIVLDPDFFFLKKIDESIFQSVEIGRPMAAYYSLGNHWTKWGKDICTNILNGSKATCSIYDSISSKVAISWINIYLYVNLNININAMWIGTYVMLLY